MRWVLRYAPKYECRWARFARPPGESWRMDETAVSVRGGRHYLFRAVDKNGKSIGSLLCNDRNKESAQAFFRAVVADGRVPWPKTINIDGDKATLRGLRLLGEEDPRWRQVEVRARRYLNNVVEQDHRAIKQRCAPMLGLQSFPSAALLLPVWREAEDAFPWPLPGSTGRSGALKTSCMQLDNCSVRLVRNAMESLPDIGGL